MENREIIAPLLKYSVTELQDESVESIMRLIDADSIRVDEIPLSDLSPTISLMNPEHFSTTEKTITFDFRFTVKNPKLSTDKLLVVLYVNLEFQNKYRPVLRDGKSYPIIKRGIYHAAREISAQLGRITEQTNYDNIQKVISIWIVNEEIPKDLRNTATRYYINKDDFIGITDEPKSEYDLIEVVIIRRGDAEVITEPLFKYLESLYNADIDEIDKYTPISANPKLKKEVESMPGMSQVIFNKGVVQGTAQGIAQGMDIGLKSLVNSLKKFISDFDTLYAEVIQNEEYKEVTKDEVKKYY